MGLHHIVFFVALVLILSTVTLTEGARFRRQDEESPIEPPVETPAPDTPPAAAAETPAAETPPPMEPTPDETGTTTVSGPPKVESTTPKEWIEKAIKKHNEYRALHGAAPLVFNESLSQISQAYANHIATTFKVQHNPALQSAKLGENLYYNSNSAPMDLDAETAVTGWYDEIQDYDFKTGFAFDQSKEILHFTQLVWKGTTDIGIALAKAVNPEGMHVTYVVANYFPRGNFDDFLTNVLPKDEKAKGGEGAKVEDKVDAPTTAGCGRLTGGAVLAVILAGVVGSFLVYFRDN